MQAVWLASALRHRAEVPWRAAVWRPVGRIVVAAAACGLAAYGALVVARAAGPTGRMASAAAQCAAAIPAGVIAYLIAARLLGESEIAALLRRRSDR